MRAASPFSQVGETPSVITCGDATFPKETASEVAGNFAAALKGVPLGELASRSDD